MTYTEYPFDNAEVALKWAVEVLRRRRMPKTQGFWQELGAEADFVAQVWEGPKNVNLPQGAEERVHLAGKVMDVLAEIEGRDGDKGKLLRWWVWGDWADERRLAAALAIQEKCRREGIRVRICYRYTYAQLAVLGGCDRKAAWRKVREGLELLEVGLVRAGLMVPVHVPEGDVDNLKKNVYFHEFK